MWLVALKGIAGTGKSTLGRSLANRLGWPFIDKDDIKDVLDGHAPEAGPLAYAIMFNVARRQLLLGMNVICDSPLSYERSYARAVDITREAGARLAIIECACPDEVAWRERIERRKLLDLPSHHQTDWATFRASPAFHPEEYAIGVPYLVLDTTRPLNDLVRDCLDWLALAGATLDTSVR